MGPVKSNVWRLQLKHEIVCLWEESCVTFHWPSSHIHACSQHSNTICVLPAPGGCCAPESPPRLVPRASIPALHSNLWAAVKESCLWNALEQHGLAWPKGLVPSSSQHHNLVGVSASAVSHWSRKKQLFLSEPLYFQPSTKQLFRDAASWDQSGCDWTPVCDQQRSPSWAAAGQRGQSVLPAPCSGGNPLTLCFTPRDASCFCQLWWQPAKHIHLKKRLVEKGRWLGKHLSWRQVLDYLSLSMAVQF